MVDGFGQIHTHLIFFLFLFAIIYDIDSAYFIDDDAYCS